MPRPPKLARIEELFHRTTQFNTTGPQVLRRRAGRRWRQSGRPAFSPSTSPTASATTAWSGAAVIEAGEIVGLAISCRVLGIGVEHAFLRHVLQEMKHRPGGLLGRIIPTPRNVAARNIYRDHGFSEREAGVWESAGRADG